jgi:hypothetical protein
MHQTFYVDIDEEITSIVEKLKSARAQEVIMIVPKRALLVQSIVNLKILKKEADELGLQLMIITQDKLGKILTEKAGILVQQKLDNVSGEEINLRNNETAGDFYAAEDRDGKINKENSRLDNIGSKEYFNEIEKEENIDKKNIVSISNENLKKEKSILNKELVADIGKEIGQNYSNSSAVSEIKPENKANFSVAPEYEKTNFSQKTSFSKENSNEKNGHSTFLQNNPGYQDRKIENFFYSERNFENKKIRREDDYEDYNLPKKTHRWFWLSGAVCLLIVAGISAYLFVPKVKIGIKIKEKTRTANLEITGNTGFNSPDYEKRIIPAKIITVDHEISQNFNSTGSEAVSNKKSRGTITIYNEYSSSSQPLVATTRFLSESGKLFRLVEGTTVPGMNDDKTPGKIEAQVVADEAGESFNIDPTVFSIPGFKENGSPKYGKIYAKSSEAISGGAAGSEKINTVTSGDITSAKNKILEESDRTLENKIKESAGGNVIVFNDAIVKEEPVYKISNSVGEASSSFQVSINVKAKALVVEEKDLKDFASQSLTNADADKAEINKDSIIFTFGKSDANFESGTIAIKCNIEGKINSGLSAENIRKEVLGKSEDDLKNYLSTFSNIEEAQVEYKPSFISGRMPFFSSQIEITLDN